MENESIQARRVSHEVEGIGTIRAQNGTALETIAGAAAYWEKEAKKVAAGVDTLLTAAHSRGWNRGFITGVLTSATLSAIAAAVVHFL